MTTQPTVNMQSRRAFIRKLATGAAALAIAGAVVAGGLPAPVNSEGIDSVSVAATGHFRTTSALNLRSQASLSSSVILVIPKGGLVAAAGPEQNGFIRVSYVGNIGWASRNFLTISNGGSNDTPVYTGNGFTTEAVNMRSGPGTNYGVIRVLQAGTSIQLFDSYSNNYRLVGFAAQTGWVAIDYIKPGGSSQQPGYLVATAALNLRSGPSLDSAVLKVIPAGAQVARGDQVNNGFRSVTYAGVTGWASTAYLK